MPYSSIEDLPDTVKHVLPKGGQEIYFSAFNAAYSGTCKDREDRDTCAAKIAWSAVGKSYVHGSDGWTRKEEAAGRGNANVTDYETFDETIPGDLKRESISDTGIARIRIIKPGWGSSGYYSESVLERDAQKVYTPGLHMYLNHPTVKEEKERPERDLRDLAGVIAGSVAYEKEGPVGPGVYADALIFKDKRGFLGEIAPYIGISHRVMGKSATGEAEGRKGAIIESLERGISVDYVTMPGAGGGIVQMFESWRETAEMNAEHEQHRESDAPKGSNEELQSKLHKAVSDRFGTIGSGTERYGTWIIATYPDHLIFRGSDDCAYEISYSVSDDGKVTLGDPSEVEVTYLKKEQESEKMVDKITIEKVRADAGLMKELREAILAEQEGEGGEGGMSKEEGFMAQIEEYKKKIAELQAELDRMKEKEAVSEAIRIATSELGKTQLPEVTRARLLNALPKNITMKEGVLDTEAFKEVLTESVKAETEYIAKLTEAGKVRGFGGKPADPNAKGVLKESFKDTFLAMGMTKEEAEKKATIAAEGR
jgi:cation transport regulator ChaB